MDTKVIVVLIALVVLVWLYGFQRMWELLFPKPAAQAELPKNVIKSSGVAPSGPGIVYIRYLRLTKVRGGGPKFVKLEAYQSNHTNTPLEKKVCVCKQWMPAVRGSVGNFVTSSAPKKPVADENAWRPLNDHDDTTVATVMDEYVELDLGEWGAQVDMVKVHHWEPGLAQGMPNGTALYVMDTERRLILQYMFRDIGAQSPAIQEIPIVISDTTDQIDDADTAMVRYLKLTRVQPGIGAPMYNSPVDNHMNIVGLEAFLGNCTPTFLWSMWVASSILRTRWLHFRYLQLQ